MSHPAPDPHSHLEQDSDARALLARAYGLQSQADSQALYRDWATTYDQTMLDGLQYQSPRLVAQLLAQARLQSAARAQAAVLDVGCGTGLAGEALVALGFAVVDGLDISPEMMAVAMARGTYRQCLQADLLAALPLADAAYDAAVCCGTFTTGHVGAGCLDEIFRVCVRARPLLSRSKPASGSAWAFRRPCSACKPQAWRGPTASHPAGCTPTRPSRTACFAWSVAAAAFSPVAAASKPLAPLPVLRPSSDGRQGP